MKSIKYHWITSNGSNAGTNAFPSSNPSSFRVSTSSHWSHQRYLSPPMVAAMTMDESPSNPCFFRSKDLGRGTRSYCKRKQTWDTLGRHAERTRSSYGTAFAWSPGLIRRRPPRRRPGATPLPRTPLLCSNAASVNLLVYIEGHLYSTQHIQCVHCLAWSPWLILSIVRMRLAQGASIVERETK